MHRVKLSYYCSWVPLIHFKYSWRFFYTSSIYKAIIMKSFHSSSFSDWENTPVCDMSSFMIDVDAIRNNLSPSISPYLPAHYHCNMQILPIIMSCLSSPRSWLGKQGKASQRPLQIQAWLFLNVLWSPLCSNELAPWIWNEKMST